MSENGEKVDVEDLVASFNQFLLLYDIFRKENNLSGEIENKYEITTSLADKVGRICRQVKHAERNDHKSDWPDGMSEDIAGVLVYLIILKNSYELDLSNGIKNELEKAVQQHSKR